MTTAGGEVVVQVAAGLGNQLFQYAMGRHLALANGVPLVLDHLSGFPRDRYRRAFVLDRFDVQCRYVPASASYATPLGRVRRRLHRWRDRGRGLAERRYVQETDSRRVEPGLVGLVVHGRTYFEGYWQHEEYFRDSADQIRSDLRVIGEHDAMNVALAARINAVDAVCLHVRRLHGVPNTPAAAPLAENARLHVDLDYYTRAMARVAEAVRAPRFFVFSDYPDWARAHLRSPLPMEFVTHNGPDKDVEDFWLMTQCRHFVIANSTFSWWAAWLGSAPDKHVIAPAAAVGKMIKSVPASWETL